MQNAPATQTRLFKQKNEQRFQYDRHSHVFVNKTPFSRKHRYKEKKLIIVQFQNKWYLDCLNNLSLATKLWLLFNSFSLESHNIQFFYQLNMFLQNMIMIIKYVWPMNDSSSALNLESAGPSFCRSSWK